MRSPVFRHAGSWRHAGTTRRSPQMPPRRWWQAIIAPQTICYIIYNQDNTHQTTAGAQPRTASGVRFRWGDLVRPACRHDPAWRNTGLRTAATTSGVAEMLASGHRFRCWRSGRTLRIACTPLLCLMMMVGCSARRAGRTLRCDQVRWRRGLTLRCARF